jgi:hypothetical protein
MKPCRKNRKLIVWSMLDALGPAQASELAQHLQHCEGCRRYRQEISQITRGLSALESFAEVSGADKVRSHSFRRLNLSGSNVRSLKARAGLYQNIFSWRVGVPGLCAIALALVVLSSVLPHRVAAPAPHPSPSVQLLSPSPDLPATVANYRAVANQSLDELDDLLAKQARRPVAAPPIFTPRTLALLQIPE